MCTMESGGGGYAMGLESSNMLTAATIREDGKSTYEMVMERKLL
jgi:hypothetical protein